MPMHKCMHCLAVAGWVGHMTLLKVKDTMENNFDVRSFLRTASKNSF